MIPRRLFLFHVLLCPGMVLAQAGNKIAVRGRLVSRRKGIPVPGLQVFLVHHAFGRSIPAISDGNGQFGWPAIPVSTEPYDLEVYWGRDLVLRSPVLIDYHKNWLGDIWL